MQSSSLEPLKRPPSLNQSVQDAIRDYILNNRLQPGDALPPETELSRQLGVSRNSIREAVKSLEMIGLVEARRGTGLFVGSFSLGPLLENLPYSLMSDLDELRELLEIRRVLEVSMIDQAIEALTEEQIERLQKITDEMGALAQEDKLFASQDRQFHQVLFEGLGNTTLIKLLDIFWLTFSRASANVPVYSTEPITTYEAHQSIVDAVIAKDIDQARKSLQEHYQGIESRLGYKKK